MSEETAAGTEGTENAGEGQNDPLKTLTEQVEALTKQVKAKDQSLTRQGYELGELRKLADQVLLKGGEKKAEVDFFSDPDKAVDQKIAEHPEVKKLRQDNEAMRKATMLATLEKAHADYKDLLADEGFQEWVQKSKVRTRLYVAADSGYDFEAADELFTNWKERADLRKSAEASGKEKTQEQLKQAKVDTGNAGASGKKVYSRVDLMKLRLADPDRYAAMNVAKLYAEGRVK